MKSFSSFLKEERRYNNAEEVINAIKDALTQDEILNPDFKRMNDAARREFGREAKLFKDKAYNIFSPISSDYNVYQDDIREFMWSVPWDSFQELNKFSKAVGQLRNVRSKATNDVKKMIDKVLMDSNSLLDKWIPVRDNLKNIKPKVVKVTQKRAEAKVKKQEIISKKMVSSSSLVSELEGHRKEYLDTVKKKTISFIDRKMKQLEDKDMDLNKLVPKNGDSQLKAFYRIITVSKNTGGYQINGPDIREISGKGVRNYIENTIKSAEMDYDAFIQKLIEKIGKPVVNAKMIGNIWTNCMLTVVCEDGEQQKWHTQAIINFSKYGKAFNQFPTRRKK